MFEFAGENALVDEFQPAVFPLNRADFVVGDGFGSRGAHGERSISMESASRTMEKIAFPRTAARSKAMRAIAAIDIRRRHIRMMNLPMLSWNWRPLNTRWRAGENRRN